MARRPAARSASSAVVPQRVSRSLSSTDWSSHAQHSSTRRITAPLSSWVSSVALRILTNASLRSLPSQTRLCPVGGKRSGSQAVKS